MAISRFQMNRQLRAYGGIMGQDGRRNYGIGSFFQKKIMDPIKKVVKSPAGLAAAALAVDQFGIPIGGGKKIGGGKNVSGFLGNIFRGIGGRPDLSEEMSEVSLPIPKPTTDDNRGFLEKTTDFLTKKRLGTDKSIAGLLMTPQALALGSGLLAGAFTKDEDDPAFTGQDVGLNLRDIRKLANVTDPKTGQAIGLSFLPDVEARKFTPAEMAASFAAADPVDFTEDRTPAEDGGLIKEAEKYATQKQSEFLKNVDINNIPRTGNLQREQERAYENAYREYMERNKKAEGGIMGDQKDFEEFLQDMQDRDKQMLQDRILEDFEKYMKRKRMIDRLPEAKDGGIMKMAEGGMMDMGGMEMDLRGGGFVPMGKAEKADDVPARLSKNEFVFTADAVRAAGGGNIDKGADKMYATMKALENKVA